MLNQKAILDTLLQGGADGLFVLRLTRPDRSVRTFCREQPDEVALADRALEVVLPEAAELVSLVPALLHPGKLPGLWQDDKPLHLSTLHAYFGGDQVIDVPRDGWTEPLRIPRAAPDVVNEAVRAAVEGGQLWLLSGPLSLLGEPVPEGALTDEATLRPRPVPVGVFDLFAANLPAAWQGEQTNALSLYQALSDRAGCPLPWPVVRQAIDTALSQRLLERTSDSGPWPCTLADADRTRLQLPAAPPVDIVPPRPDSLVAHAVLQPSELQDLADRIGDIKKAVADAGLGLQLSVRLEIAGDIPGDTRARLDALLDEITSNLRLE
jgi:hypothetical protein